jgi:peptide/nickel transport system substrate-binding protein
MAAGACRDAPKEERPLEIVVGQDPETLDPRHTTDAIGLRISRLVHAGLTRLDPDTLEVRPYLATGWTWEDGRTLAVDLRQDVRFHSGKALDSDDVAATIRAISSPKVGSRHSRIVEPIESVMPDGPHRVRFRLKRAHATLLSDLELPILRADQAEDPPHPNGDLDGLGPYVIAHARQGDVLLDPVDHGSLPKPVHGVRVRTVRDENARALRLVGGRTDAAVNVVSPMLLPALESEPGLEVRARPGANITYVVVRPQGDLADPNVRRALSLAIDRETIAKGFFGSHARPASTLIAPGHWAHVDLPPIPFDPARAKELLAGRRPHIDWLVTPERLRAQIARFVAQTLGEAGFDVTLVPLEFGSIIARLNAGDFDCATMQIPEIGEPNVLRVFLHSTMAPPAGANRGRIADPDIDAALDDGDSSTDLEFRKAAYAKLEAIESDRLYLVPLLHEDPIVVTSPRAKGFLPSADGRWLGVASLP